MNFDFSEEQIMLRDSVARFIQDDYDFDTRRQIAASDAGMDGGKWQTFAELGWLSSPFDEQYGGFGGSALDVAVVMEELGKGLVLEPYLATVPLFGGLLQKGGSEELKSEYLPGVIDGSCLGAFAFLERQNRFELADITTRADAVDGGYRLNGEKVVVFNGANAGQLIVSAIENIPIGMDARSSSAGISVITASFNIAKLKIMLLIYLLESRNSTY